jgi:hypothetical protein
MDEITSIQADVDKNSALIVQIIKLQEAYRTATDADSKDAIDKKIVKIQRSLNARLMQLAKWADSAPDMPREPKHNVYKPYTTKKESGRVNKRPRDEEKEPATIRKSKYRGLCYIGKKWKAQITFASTTHHLGMFDDEVEAARVYDTAARKFHGAKAQCNFPL